MGVAGVIGFVVILLVVVAIITGLDQDGEPRKSMVIPGNEYVEMTEEEFAERLRDGGLSEEEVARELAQFEGNKAEFRGHQAKFATPVPREWTAVELAECDTSTLKRQVETSESTGELLSDCEVAFSLAQLETSVAIIEMPAQGRAAPEEHMEILVAIDQAVEKTQTDNVIDLDEYMSMCSVVPQWTEQVQGVSRYLASLGSSDLPGVGSWCNQDGQVCLIDLRGLCSRRSAARRCHRAPQ